MVDRKTNPIKRRPSKARRASRGTPFWASTLENADNMDKETTKKSNKVPRNTIVSMRCIFPVFATLLVFVHVITNWDSCQWGFL
jgi:hypothetical protein